MPLSLGRALAGFLRSSFTVRHSSSSPPPPSAPPTASQHPFPTRHSPAASVASGSQPPTPRRSKRHRRHRHAHCHPGMLLCPTALPRRSRRRKYSAHPEHSRNRIASSHALKRISERSGAGGDADAVCDGGDDDSADDSSAFVYIKAPRRRRHWVPLPPFTHHRATQQPSEVEQEEETETKELEFRASRHDSRRRPHRSIRTSGNMATTALPGIPSSSSVPSASTGALQSPHVDFHTREGGATHRRVIQEDSNRRLLRGREKNTGQLRQEHQEIRSSTVRDDKTRGKLRCEVDRLPSLNRRHRQRRKDPLQIRQLKSDHQDEETRFLRSHCLRSAMSAPAAVTGVGMVASGAGPGAAVATATKIRRENRRRRRAPRETEIPAEHSRETSRRNKRSTKRPQGFAMVLLRAAGRALESQSLSRRATVTDGNVQCAIGTESSSQGTCSTNVAPPSPPRVPISSPVTYKSRSLARGSPAHRRVVQTADASAGKSKAGCSVESSDRDIASAPAARISFAPSPPTPPSSSRHQTLLLRPPPPPPPPLPSPPITTTTPESSKIPSALKSSHREKTVKEGLAILFSENTLSSPTGTKSGSSKLSSVNLKRETTFTSEVLTSFLPSTSALFSEQMSPKSTAASTQQSIVCEGESMAESSICDSQPAPNSSRTIYERSKVSSPVSSQKQGSSRGASPPLNLESSRLTSVSNTSTKSSKSETLISSVTSQLLSPTKVPSVNMQCTPHESPRPATSSKSLSSVSRKQQISPYLNSPSRPTSSPLGTAKSSKSSCAISRKGKLSASTSPITEGKCSPSSDVTPAKSKEILASLSFTVNADPAPRHSPTIPITRATPNTPMQSLRPGILSSPPLSENAIHPLDSARATGNACLPGVLDRGSVPGSTYWPQQRRESEDIKPPIREDKCYIEDLDLPPSSFVHNRDIDQSAQPADMSIHATKFGNGQSSYNYDSYSQYPQYSYNARSDPPEYQHTHNYGYNETYTQPYGYNRPYEYPYSERAGYSPPKYNSDLTYADLPVYSESFLDRPACVEGQQLTEGRAFTDLPQSQEKVSEGPTYTEVTLFENPESEVRTTKGPMSNLVGATASPKNLGIPMDIDTPKNTPKCTGQESISRKPKTTTADTRIELSSFDSSEDEVTECKIRPRDGGGDGLRTLFEINKTILGANEGSRCSWDEVTSDEPAGSDCSTNDY